MIKVLFLIAKTHFQIQQVATKMTNYQILAKKKNHFQSDDKKNSVREKRKDYYDR